MKLNGWLSADSAKPAAEHNTEYSAGYSSEHSVAATPGIENSMVNSASDATSSANQALEKLRRQNELILNSVGEGIYGIDNQGNATFVNPAAAAMIGWTAEELIGKSMHTVLHHSRADGVPYLREECPIYAAFQDGIVHRINHEVFWRKDGTSFPVEYVSTPMWDEQGCLLGAVVVFRDITKRKWAEAVLQRTAEDLELKVQERTAELQQVNEQLKELNELKTRLVSMVCHEFRNPLNNILLSASYLDRYDSQLLLNQKIEYLGDIRSNVERMTQMIDDILVIGKTEAKKIDVQLSPLDLVKFCTDLTEEVQSTASNTQIKFISRRKHFVIQTDEMLLRSILTNILSNSIRYSPLGSTVKFSILYAQERNVIFQIKDQGIGIPAEDLPHLFEPFHRGRNVSNIPGTGLGLSIVKRFTDLLQGTLEIDSKIGRGTIFTICLPC